MSIKKIVACALLGILVVTFAVYNSNDEFLTWAKNLRVEDVAMIEAVAMPSYENQRYKYYNASEFERIVKL